MEAMDRARRIGGWLWVAAGLCFELARWLVDGVAPGPVTWVLVVAVCVLAVVLGIRPGTGTAWTTGWVVAVLLAVDLAGAVADRFGALGGPGDPGVSWGSWDAFVAYTGRLLHHPGHLVVTVAAVGATALELGLAVLLVSGRQRRWTGKAVAGLFVVYLVAMASSVGADEVARYAVPVLVGGALLVSACPSARPSAARGSTVDGRATVVTVDG